MGIAIFLVLWVTARRNSDTPNFSDMQWEQSKNDAKRSKNALKRSDVIWKRSGSDPYAVRSQCKKFEDGLRAVRFCETIRKRSDSGPKTIRNGLKRGQNNSKGPCTTITAVGVLLPWGYHYRDAPLMISPDEGIIKDFLN